MKKKSEKIIEQYNKLKVLLKKKEGFLRDYYDLSDFQEPVIFLMRNNRKVDFIEGVSGGKYVFEKSDGKEGVIMLNPTFLHNFSYGKKVFRGYICHEDYTTPLPEDPVVTAEVFKMSVDKTLIDVANMRAKELEAQASMVWAKWIGLGIIILLLALFLPDILKIITNFFGKGGETEVAKTILNGTTTVLE